MKYLSDTDLKIAQLEAELEEYKHTFALIDKAQGRAIKLWRKQDPKNRKLILPDMAHLTLWLLDQLKH